MSLRVYTTAAVVLHRINLGEYDKILTLYTEERGKLNAICKGARKPVSKLAGATELFTHSRMQLAVGRTLDVVTQAETQDSFQRIRNDLARIAYASVMAEMVDRFVEERDPHPDLFAFLVGSLRALDRGRHLDLIAQAFELHFLADLGYRPHLSDCLACGDRLDGGLAVFVPSLGGVVCGAHGRRFADAIPTGPDVRALAERLMEAGPGDDAAIEGAARVWGIEARRELDRLLRAHVQYRLERPIRSLDFVYEVQATYAADPGAGAAAGGPGKPGGDRGGEG